VRLEDPVLAIESNSSFDYKDLTDSYQYIDENKNVKAKVWEKGKQKRIYFRTRRHDDKRKFREFYIELPIEKSEKDTKPTQGEP